MLNLKRLRIFREVAERGSFSSAALALDYTQSVVSHHVAQLERELGMSLFERGRRPVRLSPAGEVLREHADAVLGTVAAAEEEMRALAGIETGLLRIGAFLSACVTLMPSAIAAFERRHPGIEVRLHQEEPPVSIPRLVAGELDIAVVFHEHGNERRADDRLEQLTIAEDAYRVVMHPRHRLARRREVRIADLRGERFVGPRAEGDGTRYRAVVERLCAEEGFAPDFAYSVTDVTVARAFAATGLAVAIMPELTVPHPRPDVVVSPMRGVRPFRTIDVHWVRGRRAAAVAPMVSILTGGGGEGGTSSL